MPAAPLVPPAADPAAPPAAPPAARPTAAAAGAPLPAPPPMDRDFITRHRIVERYLAGQLPPKGAQDFERFCAAHPELVDGLALAEHLHRGLQLLEAGGVALPWEPPARRWWDHAWVSLAAVAMMVAALAATSTLAARVRLGEKTIRELRAQLQALPLDPATSTHGVRLVPSRTAPSRLDAVVFSGAAEMADVKIDMSWSAYTAFRVTIDRMDQGRVAVLHNLQRDSNGDLHVSFNTAALGPGSYQFAIEGLTVRNEPVAQAWVTVGLSR